MGQSFGEQLLQQSASTATNSVLGGVMGIAMGAINDKRQLRQQEKLQELQMKGQRSMIDYQKLRDLEFWKNTSYPAQKELMEKAGLNPALMYGMGGGGGQSIGGSAPGVTQGHAPSGGGEIQAAMGMQLQNAMLQAQISNINADTKVKEGEAANKGIQGKQIEATIENLTAGTENTRAQTRLTNVQTGVQEIEYSIKADTYEDTEKLIKQTARQAEIAADILANDKTISNETVVTKISTMRANLMLLQTENELKKSGIKLNEQQIDKLKADIAQGWTSLNIQQQNAISQRIMADASKQNADTNVRQFLQGVNKDLWDAETQRGFLRLQQMINDIPESDKITMESLTKILSFGMLGQGVKEAPETFKPNAWKTNPTPTIPKLKF